MQEQILVLLFLISTVCFSEIKSEIEDRFKEDFYNIYKHVAIDEKEVANEHVTPDKIKYVLFTNKNPEKSIEVDSSDPKELNNPNVPIIFIIHGWIENREKEWYKDLKNAFLNRKPESYVIEVDWSEPAHQLYSVSSWNTKDVGATIGKFVVGLHKKYSVPLKNFLIVGHSLGGQVSGFIGKKVKELTNEQLPRIIALDPAGPAFTNRPEDERLNKNDAKVVHVIHTNGGTFGFKASCGTIDFFPNGGSLQPGCATIDLMDIKSVAEPVACNHQRSWKYFIEAVLNPTSFMGVKCGGWLQYKTNFCDKKEVAMGDLETTETGDFYLETNKDKPFGKKSGVDDNPYVLPVPTKIF
ncbi:pancreatic triacylglycerol lipase-like [Zophobas morio]|uniref:pancreatic triacylglycerol lipase-like n=1 Tax=Zophobas morio TaxID=2755281 RepID=UPI003083990B